MISIDTNIFIYWLEQNADFYPQSADIFRRIHSGAEPASCSVLVLSEIYSGSAKPLEAISKLPGLTITAVTKEIAELAGQLRHTHRLKVIDAIHLATALHNQAKIFVTNDQQLAKLKIRGLTMKKLKQPH